MIKKRIKRFVNKMGYPTYVKMIGMTESKRLLLRKTLTLDATYSTDNNTPEGKAVTNIFQVVLNPLECPNITKAFSQVTFMVKKTNESGQDVSSNETFKNFFRYDYLKVRNIFISIKPSQTVSAKNTSQYSDDNTDDGVSNVYAYFTYRYPMLSPNDIDENIKSMYSTNPVAERIIQEGRLKNVYTWPSNKAMTISLNTLKYRINSEPYKLCANTPLDIQFLSSLCPTNANTTGVYDPFKYASATQNLNAERTLEEEDGDDDNGANYGATMEDDRGESVNIPDLYCKDYNLYFGRLVIVSPKKIRFTTEICYDCMLYR